MPNSLRNRRKRGATKKVEQAVDHCDRDMKVKPTYL